MSIFEPLVKKSACRFSEFLEILQTNSDYQNLAWSSNIWLNRYFVRFPPGQLAKLLSPENERSECSAEQLAIFYRATNHWKLRRSVFKNSVDSLTYDQLLVVFGSKSDDPVPQKRDSVIIAILNYFSKEKDKGCSRNRDNSPTRK